MREDTGPKRVARKIPAKCMTHPNWLFKRSSLMSLIMLVAQKNARHKAAARESLAKILKRLLVVSKVLVT